MTLIGSNSLKLCFLMTRRRYCTIFWVVAKTRSSTVKSILTSR